MKKRAAVFLVIMLLFTACAGNQKQPVQTTQSVQTTEQTQSSQQKEEEDAILTICVDQIHQEAISELIQTWKKINNSWDAKLIVIPQDYDAAEIKISELRAEIMSGEGPDIFILQGMYPNTEKEMKVLFSNPEKIMYREIFLPLDKYMERAQYMHPDLWNQTVLESGRTEEGQLLLPIYYSYYASAFRTADLADSKQIPISWEQWIACEDEAIMRESFSKMFLVFYDILGKLADYQNETLLISEEELLKRVQEAALYSRKGQYLWNSAEAIENGIVDESFFSELAKDREEHTILAYPNIEGGITANVTVYAAINRNTRQAEKAFSLLDLLFSDEIMCGKGFQFEDRAFGNTVLSWMGIGGGLPIHNIAAQNLYRGLFQEDIDSFTEINHQIQTVRYHSDFDRLLFDMYSRCCNTEEEIKQKEIVNQYYQALQMKLSE